MLVFSACLCLLLIATHIFLLAVCIAVWLQIPVKLVENQGNQQGENLSEI